MAAEQKPRIRKKWAVALIGIFIVVCLGGLTLLVNRFAPGLFQTPGPEATIPVQSGTSSQAGETSSAQGGEKKMNILLSEGQSQPEQVEQLPLATGDPLSEEEIARILARLPGLKAGSAQQAEFKFPTELLPPPRPGETVRDAFPPTETGIPPVTGGETGPLEVLRYAPEGEIPIAPFISVTFNQPMVPLGTLSDLALRDVPVVIEPSLPGTWRWLGTKTLTFEYDSDLVDRLPKATAYRVTVPAGTKSMSGNALAEAVTWTFTTPPPKVTATYPYDEPQPLDPLFVIGFDQRIDPAAMLGWISVNAGGRDVTVRLASEEEAAQNNILRNQRQPEGRWLAFKALEPLPADARVTVTVRAGAPSAEGPLVTRQAQSYGFSTYAPLRIEQYGCSWYGDQCPPLTPFYIQFNNPIDPQTFGEGMLRVEPEIPGASVDVYGNTLNIRGQTRGQTTYTVTVSGKIRDSFGQELGQDRRLTFRVDKAEPVLAGPEQVFVTLDPSSAKPVFSVYAINYNRLRARIYTVQPADWPTFKTYLREWRRENPPPMPGTLVADQNLSLSIPSDTLTQVDIDLSPYTQNGYGQFIVVVEPPKPLIELNPWERQAQAIQAWVQVTQIGLDAFHDQEQMTAWATHLQTGAPLSGVTITAGEQTYQTGTDGIARFDIPSGATYLTARRGDDLALLPQSTYYWGDGSWQSVTIRDSLRWYVFDDRAMYRPGEQVHLKGWVRRAGGGKGGDVGLANEVRDITYRITDPTGNETGSGQVSVNALGGFDLAFTIPEQVNLGQAQVIFSAQASLDGLIYAHSFQIQEFRRPEFEVTARNETSGPYFVDGSAVVAVEAKYYAGGPLPNAEVTWQVTTSPGSYSPPKWPDFTFGEWIPWWRIYGERFPGGGETTTETFIGKTDAGGQHYLKLDFEQQGQPDRPRPLSVVAEATVMDVNRQAWASATTLLVHPSNLYIGLRSERYFVSRGTPLKVDFIVADLDGNPTPGRPVEVRAARLEWKFRDGEWREEETTPQTCALNSARKPLTCTFETNLGGSYKITATVTDSLGRRNQSSITRWVSGGQQPPARKVEQEEVSLIPDKESYQPGETAQILVQSPFNPAEGLLTVSRSGTLYTQRFTITDGTATLQIPIREEHIPNLQIQVDLVGESPRTDEQGGTVAGAPPRPAYATGTLNLKIPPVQRTLSLEVTPEQDKLEPGGQTTVNLALKDSNGLPVADAELAVVVVDEAVLALTNYQLSDPLKMFYTERGANLSSYYARASIVLVDPLSLAENIQEQVQDKAFRALPMAAGAPEVMATQAAALPDTAAGSQATAPEPIRIRVDFNPLANFSPSVQTDFSGRARVSIRLPDNLTRYRIMVVAVDKSGSKFGVGEANLTARLPLMVRPSAPRFLNFGDKFELPVVLQNQTDLPMTVEVAVRAANLQLEQAGLRVTIPANDRVEVRFPASTVMAGAAQIQVAAISGAYSDAASIELPVYTPATSEAFATYGVLDQGAVAQPVQQPTGVSPQYGGLEISTSSTALSALTDAVLYLQSYPFECSEQLASRILSVAALRDVLSAFKAEGLPAPAEMESALRRDIETLQGMQNADGGFPYWQRGFDSVPFNTIHVAHALIRAKQKGFDVPSDMLDRALAYLWNIEGRYPNWYNEQTRWTLSAYALYVRNLNGERDSVKAEKLLRETGLENLRMEAIGWLWPVIEDKAQREAIRRFVGNRIVETAGAANFTTSYDDQTYLLLSSNRRTDAILLDALMEDNPQSDLIPKVVNGLLAHRTRGRWGNTQENVFVLLSLDRYFNTYETQTPNFVARIWLGETYAGSGEFRGRTTEQHELSIPMDFVLNQTALGGGTENLILGKEGPGRLYYRLGLRYAPGDLQLGALDMGFVVTRSYEAVDNPDDVYRDSEGRWHIKAGARVRVKLTMVADNRRYHVALVDPLPAGLEIVNPALAVSGSVPQDPNDTTVRYGWWWWGPWYEHQNMRDQRAEAFASLLWDGVYQYSYIARATTPGIFIVPPAKAEEMYSPEVFGRSASDWVIVE
ncbi:MAG: MG2 domain-containing protein [Anaerolineales bacterium]